MSSLPVSTSPSTVCDINPESTLPSAPAWRLLVVGGDPAWFQQFERDLGCLQSTWSCFRAEDSSSAMDSMLSSTYDALILDSRSPDGVALLRVMGREIGRTILFVRCDVSDREAVTRWDKSGATPISDDADSATFAASLKRAARLRNWMLEPGLKALMPKIVKLPTSPKLHTQVTKELQSPDGSIAVVGDLITADPVMSAKILQVANSALFSLDHEVTDAMEAVMVMGTERIRSLILLAGVFSQYGGAKCPGFSPEPIWGHSLQVAAYARAIALAETKDPKSAEAAFTAGLLHDIGKLILAGNLPDTYDAIRREQLQNKGSMRDAEIKVMGTTHAELGACLLATWGLPLPILEAIAWHHQPHRADDVDGSLLAFVHAANVFSKEGKQAAPGGEAQLDTEFIVRIGLVDYGNRWRAACGLAARTEPVSTEELIRRRAEAKKN